MIGQSLKNYVVEEQLGKGGMGVVYRARDTKLGRKVALKVLPPELVRDEERRRRFLQEAKAASAVNHPAIAQIYEIEAEGDVTFIVMEYVDGSTVRDLVARKELDVPSAIEVAILVADGLARAHEAGIVHRDIKSDNIMVTKDGHPKILDFGLAKLLIASPGGAGGGPMETIAITQAMTQAGMVVGTVAYMSPEQARGLPTDKRSDIFSLGVVLYEMATGKLPFAGASALDTMHAIAFDATRPIATLRADLPYSLQRVIDRCLQKKPEDRYQDLRETVTDLKSVKREIESGVSGGKPLLERVRWRMRGLSTRGQLYVGVGGAVLGGLLVAMILGRAKFNPGSLFVFVGAGFWAWSHFRNRSLKQMRRFVKKAKQLKEVRMVSFQNGEFTVVADHPTTKTYLRLNGFLGSINSGLFRGKPMTMAIREEMDEAELRKLLMTSSVQYLRDAS